MKISVVTANYNGARFLDEAMRSVLSQRAPGLEVEYILVDGGSTDGSAAIIRQHEVRLARVIREPDSGPADAIRKGLSLATGDVLGWLNADDRYFPGALPRVRDCLERHPRAALCFGHCPIIDDSGREIRHGITRFKECFFPLSCRAAIQCINYISQPAMFFRRAAYAAAGPLRLDMKAAWDYDLILRLWRHGGAVRVPGAPLAAFRWHAASISGQHFARQFAEEWQAAREDAGAWSPQALAHWFVRWGIVGAYTLMARRRKQAGA